MAAQWEAEAVAWLDGSEQRRREQLHTAMQKREFALCRSVLRHLLCCRLGCLNGQLTFGRQSQGKPFAIVKGAAHPVAFNVSHSGQHGLVALAQGGSLGVDVEERRQRVHREGIAARMFAPEERAALSRLPEEQQLFTFYRFWTLREAVGKALGCGLAWAPAAFVLPQTIRCGAASDIVTLNSPPRTRWWVQDMGTACFAAAVSCKYDSSAPVDG
ncbi:4'-phosphopantetheinyl transferase family protein [Candidatus Synechococcus spongiarum]|nr:4'-phosphopantetheinyl transferase superfamily protein [Candidatus Synechococcus spongiarum]